MKAAHFLPHYPGREGTTSFCRALSLALNALSDASSCIISFKPEKNLNATNVVSYVSPSRNPFSIPSELREDLMSGELGLDGVVLHGAFNPRMAAMGKLLNKAGIPYIFMPHDPYVPELMNHGRIKKWLYWQICEKTLIDRARGIILLSSSHETPLREKGYKGDVAVVANGCSQEIDIPKRTREVGGVRRIQYLGRMDRNHKGLDLLIMAFARFVSGRKGEVELLLSGNDWEDRNMLENLVQNLGVANEIKFTGPRDESAQAVFVEADLAILPSRFDGFGLTIVEAMQTACPVIATDACGVAEHVIASGGGFTCAASVDGLTNVLEDAWREREKWNDMGEMARDYVVHQLTWEQAAIKSADVYRSWFK